MAKTVRGGRRGPDEWWCECGDHPPPIFRLPPPPRLPALPGGLGSSNNWGTEDHSGDCDTTWSGCPAYNGAAEEDPRFSSAQGPFLVIIVTASALVLICIITAAIVYKLRCRGRSAKSCTELSGAIIYDDLSARPVQGHIRTRPRFKPIPLARQEALSMGIHLYTPTPHSRPESEHLYMSISSGSETCSYSTSEAIPHIQNRILTGRLPYSYNPTQFDSEEEPLAPSTTDGSDDTPVRTPYHAQHHAMCHSSQHTPQCSPTQQRHYFFPSAPERSPSPKEENMYYVNNTQARPATPQERGLPPLPSRTDRFKIYFSNDQSESSKNIPGGHLKRCPPKMNSNNRSRRAFNDGWNSDRGSYQPIILSPVNKWGRRQPDVEHEPMYENA